MALCSVLNLERIDLNMALLPVYAVDGGRVPASMLRMMAWVSTGGASGIVTPNDFKVRALATPGGAVSINAGGAVIPTRFGNSTKQQSYVVANDQAFNVNIPAAGAAGRTDYVILRVSDPQYSGQTPPDPLNALYCEVVTVASLPTNYPFIPLAKIVLPANTATITNAMITDLRQMANPRTKRELRVLNLPIGQVEKLTDNRAYPVGTTWPQQATDNWGPIDIPEWATRMKIIMTWASVRVPAGNATGHVWVQVGLTANPDKVITQATAYDTLGLTQYSRDTLINADEVAIPAALRGTAQRFYPRGSNMSANQGSAPQLEVVSTTAMVLEVEFMERPD